MRISESVRESGGEEVETQPAGGGKSIFAGLMALIIVKLLGDDISVYIENVKQDVSEKCSERRICWINWNFMSKWGVPGSDGV